MGFVNFPFTLPSPQLPSHSEAERKRGKGFEAQARSLELFTSLASLCFSSHDYPNGRVRANISWGEGLSPSIPLIQVVNKGERILFLANAHTGSWFQPLFQAQFLSQPLEGAR